MSRTIRAVDAVSTPAGAAAMAHALLTALDDPAAPAVLPVDPADGPARDAVLRAARLDLPIDDDIALLVPTSGSTGEPKLAQLSAAALRASGSATHARFGGAGRWLLALPLTHIAGLNVLLRSWLAGYEPVALDLSGGFRAADLVAGAARMDDLDAAAGAGRTRRYLSLVPTQLHRVLDDPAATGALAGFDALLLGGAAAPAPLLARARAAGVHVVTSYGMTETVGGCVYDGVPLDGVRMRLAGDGRIQLGGAVLARGYRGLPELSARAFADGWFTTADLGAITGSAPDGAVLRVLGRADDVAITGGEKVVLGAVEASLAAHPAVREVSVVAVPDPEWGERIVAWVIPAATAAGDDAARDLADDDREAAATLREHVRADLGRAAVPREIRLVDELPRLALGKVDRAGLRAAART